MGFPGYKKPTNALIDAGVLYARDPVGGITIVAVGATRGGLAFNPNATMRHVEFDGRTSEIQGLHRVTEYNPELTGQLIDISVDQLGRLEPGSTTDDSGSSTRVQPIGATEFLAEGAYIKDLLWANRTMDNARIIVVGMPCAVVASRSFKSEPHNETPCDVVIRGVIPVDATDINAPPYSYFEVNSLDDLDALLPGFWNIDGYEG